MNNFYQGTKRLYHFGAEEHYFDSTLFLYIVFYNTPRNDFKFIHLELCCIYLRLNAKVQNILWAASTI